MQDSGPQTCSHQQQQWRVHPLLKEQVLTAHKGLAGEGEGGGEGCESERLKKTMKICHVDSCRAIVAVCDFLIMM